MDRTSFIPRADADKTPWLNNFASKLGTYAAKYGITAAEKTDVMNTSIDWDYRYGVVVQLNAFKESAVKWKNFLRDGAPAGTVVSPPVLPTFGTAPTATASGAFARIAALAKRIKAHKDYSEADGRDLGIEGPDDITFDIAGAKPVIVRKPDVAGHPLLGWTLGKMDGVNIYKDDGTGIFRFYARDNHPDFEDKAPLPAQAATWRYKFVYVIGDEEVGQISDIVTVHVGQ